MLRLNRYMIMLLAATIVHPGVGAQTKNAVPQSVANIFNDLPVNDASASSVLHEGEKAAEKIAANIFVTTSLNTKQCFVGEPVLFTATLHSALQSQSVVQTSSGWPGFVVTEMDTGNERPQYKKVAGKNYRVFSIRRLQLLPVQEGVLTIDRFVVSNTIRYTDDNDREQTYSGTVHSEPLTLIVKPLPAKDRPGDFAGPVGKFSVLATVKRIQVRAGETDTLHIDIAGTGNFTDSKLPVINWPEGVEHFPAKEELTLNDSSFPFAGNKTFDIPFVASTPGKLVIPALSLAYFDPAMAAYKTVTSPAIALNVLPAVVEKRPAPVINALKPNNNSKIVISSAVLLVILAVIYFIRKRAYKATAISTQTTDAPTAVVPADHNQMLHDLHIEQPVEQYLQAIKIILYTFLEKELGIGGRSEEVLVNELLHRQSQLANDVQQLFARCNQLLYAPGDIDELIKQDMEAQLERILNYLL